MKHKFVFIVGLVLILIVGVTAATLGSQDVTTNLTPAEKAALESVGITDPDISALECEGERCFFTLTQTQIVNVPEDLELGDPAEKREVLVWRRKIIIPNTQGELLDLRDDAIEIALKNYANATMTRDLESKTKELEGGKVTINKLSP